MCVSLNPELRVDRRFSGEASFTGTGGNFCGCLDLWTIYHEYLSKHLRVEQESPRNTTVREEGGSASIGLLHQEKEPWIRL